MNFPRKDWVTIRTIVIIEYRRKWALLENIEEQYLLFLFKNVLEYELS